MASEFVAVRVLSAVIPEKKDAIAARARKTPQADAHPKALRKGKMPESLLDLARDAKLTAAMYAHSDVSWPEGYRVDHELHEADVAVIFQLGGLGLGVTWDMQGEREALRVIIGEWSVVSAEMAEDWEDVSHLEPYSRVMGARVRNLAASETRLALAFLDMELVVELGEWTEQGIVPVPDSILLRFHSAS